MRVFQLMLLFSSETEYGNNQQQHNIMRVSISLSTALTSACVAAAPADGRRETVAADYISVTVIANECVIY